MNRQKLESALAEQKGSFEWNGDSYEVRGMTAVEQKAFLDEYSEGDLLGAPLRMLARCLLLDEPLTPDEAAELSAKFPVTFVTAGWKEVSRLSGMGEEGEEIERDFARGQTVSS